jgi:hypothetical protein
MLRQQNTRQKPQLYSIQGHTSRAFGHFLSHSILGLVTSSPIISGIIRSSDLAMTTVEETTMSRFGHGARPDSNADESLEDEEKDDDVDALSSIEINLT